MLSTPDTPRGRLLEILSWGRPHDSECERRFARSFLDTVAGMQRDKFGNRYIRIGQPRVLWSCHIDTVCHQALAGPQELTFSHETGIVKLADERKKTSLGADDGVGVWIMLEMIRHGRPGLYVFHRGEEVGCLGSCHIRKHEPHLLEGIQAAIAFDRAGYKDVITHQVSGRTASDKFAESLAAQLNKLDGSFSYRPDPTGVYTDTNEYADVIPECTNLSVGYYGQHGPGETLDLYHAEALMYAMLEFDTDLLIIDRDPNVIEFEDYVGRGGRGASKGWSRDLNTPFDELLEIITEFPEAAAAILLGKGVTPNDLWNEVIDFEDRDEPYGDVPWHPIMET
jgi:hypothetical protein